MRVAVYRGEGADPDGVHAISTILDSVGQVVALPPADCVPERLTGVDLVVLPGGRGSAMCAALGDAGKAALRRFVHNGGSLLGVCAGLYAMSAGYDWSLALLPVRVLDTRHWRRGSGLLPVELTAAGRSLFGTDHTSITASFTNGPVVARIQDGTRVLGVYAEELTHPEGRRGIMVGSPAALVGRYGAGSVLGIGPHLEDTPGLEHLLGNAATALTA